MQCCFCLCGWPCSGLLYTFPISNLKFTISNFESLTEQFIILLVLRVDLDSETNNHNLVEAFVTCKFLLIGSFKLRWGTQADRYHRSYVSWGLSSTLMPFTIYNGNGDNIRLQASISLLCWGYLHLYAFTREKYHILDYFLI